MMYEEDDDDNDDSDGDDDMMIPTHLSSKESAPSRRAGFGKWLGNPRPVVHERLVIFAQSTHTGRSGCAPY